MYIEVIHNKVGEIRVCVCVDTLPEIPELPILVFDVSDTEDMEHARINLDTVLCMEIDQQCGQKAIINPETQKPEIVHVDRATFIRENFKVDIGTELMVPPGLRFPEKIKLRRLAKATPTCKGVA